MHKTNIPPCKIIRNIDINWKLFKKILSYRTYTRDKEAQKEFSDYLCSYISTLGDVNIEEDKVGNLYITKGKADLYTCVVSHQDINQNQIDSVSIVQTSKLIIGVDNSTGLQCGIGADDKCGVYFALHCLKTMESVKCLFTVDEEVGAVGAYEADISFMEDVNFIIQLDRNSWENDISSETNGEVVVSQDFMSASSRVLNKYNYDYTVCMFTDVGVLAPASNLCGINISAGYFDEHTEIERISIPHFINAIAFAEELIEVMAGQKWENNYDISRENPEEYYHYCSGWDFKKEDDSYVQDCINIGECPLCACNDLKTLKDGIIVCDNCDSYYNIPEEKHIGIW